MTEPKCRVGDFIRGDNSGTVFRVTLVEWLKKEKYWRCEAVLEREGTVPKEYYPDPLVFSDDIIGLRHYGFSLTAHKC